MDAKKTGMMTLGIVLILGACGKKVRGGLEDSLLQETEVEEPTLSACHPNLIEDGSFESGHGLSGNSGWDVYSEITHWSTSEFHEENAGFEIQKGNTGGLLPQDGLAKVELDAHKKNGFSSSNGSVAQEIETTAFQEYEILFHYAPRRASVGDSNAFGVYVNGVLIEEIVNDGSVEWNKKSLLFEADCSTAVIEFRAHGQEDSYGALIDNVSVRQKGHDPSLCEI